MIAHSNSFNHNQRLSGGSHFAIDNKIDSWLESNQNEGESLANFDFTDGTTNLLFSEVTLGLLSKEQASEENARNWQKLMENAEVFLINTDGKQMSIM